MVGISQKLRTLDRLPSRRFFHLTIGWLMMMEVVEKFGFSLFGSNQVFGETDRYKIS
jgi:hypothetical protein